MNFDFKGGQLPNSGQCASAPGQVLPIHFFTIVLNGEPFIRHHIEEFKKLGLPWHWHIVEGVANLVKDTGWSLATKGSIPPESHRQGLSVDGTTAYLDNLQREFPQNVSIYRKPNGASWDGKVEMVNAPLVNIKTDCLLWQLDSDELWKAKDIERMQSLFLSEPERTGAFFHCDYFVGPRKYVSSLNTWATMPEDWPRVWNYRPGMSWRTHEPACLIDQHGQDVIRIKPFTRDETRAAGITFQHFAYVTEEQVKFKENYYGYHDALVHWRKLQATSGQVNPANYLPWARDDNAVVEDWGITKGELLSERLTPRATQLVNAQAQLAPKSYSSMSVHADTQFEMELRKLFQAIRPRSIIETGTYHGKGTTSAIWRALRDLNIEADFTTIEVNPGNHAIANEHFRQNGMVLRSELGLSLPRSWLPTPEQINQHYVQNKAHGNIYYDHSEAERTALYFAETNYNVPDDLLRKTMERLNFRPDFVLLDSAGHVGTLEFEYFLELIEGPCYIMCDDVYHCKHYDTLLTMKADPRFEIMVESPEKFGFCIVHFTPIRSLAWVRTDSIGDAILASPLLEAFKKRYKNCRITVVCQERLGCLFELSPYVDELVTFDRVRLETEEHYRSQVTAKLNQLKPDLVVNSIFSRDALSDYIALNCAGTKSIAFVGDNCNIPEEVRLKHNSLYTRVLTTSAKHQTELERYRELLESLGIKTYALKTSVWIGADDERDAERVFAEHGFVPSQTILLCSGAQWQGRHYEKFGEALSTVVRDRGFSLIAVGVASEYELNQKALNAASATRTLNLSGKLPLRQTAALVKRARLVVSADTSVAHISCALNTANVVVLGGGHFGRFFPYHNSSSVVCLPLECFGCNWQCKFARAHCIKDVPVELVERAIIAALDSTSETPRLYIATPQPGSGLIAGPWESYLNPARLSIIRANTIQTTNTSSVSGITVSSEAWQLLI